MKFKYLIIALLFLITIASVSAEDLNQTDDIELQEETNELTDENNTADLSVDIQTDSMDVNVNDTVPWTITVKSTGGISNNTEVSCPVPKELKLLRYSAYAGSYNKNNGIWKVGDLNDGDEKSLYLLTKVLRNGVIKFSANATTSSEDTNLSNNNQDYYLISSVLTQNKETPKVDLSVGIKTDGFNSKIGDIVKWYITLKNTGGIAYNTKVYLEFSEGMKYLSQESSMGRYDPKTKTWIVGDVPPSKQTLVITTKVIDSWYLSLSAYALTDSADINMLNNYNKTHVEKTSMVITSSRDESANNHHKHYSTSDYSEYRSVTKSVKKTVSARTEAKVVLSDKKTANPILLAVLTLFTLLGSYFKLD